MAWGVRTSLAADVVAHMAEEPEAWARTDVPVAAPDLARVLQNTHLRLKPDAGMVSYAASCLFRGHQVPHLVVQTSMGPVTVMVLVHESVSKAVPFDEEGYRGVILPVPGHGSLAVLVHDQQGDLSAVQADRLARAGRDRLDELMSRSKAPTLPSKSMSLRELAASVGWSTSNCTATFSKRSGSDVMPAGGAKRAGCVGDASVGG